MATLFVALQCVQCSTMQVKQQKKSSNKWVCAVCNQRQSVCRVHARGHRAADLRRFVQACNLSRGLGAPEAPAAPAPEEAWGAAGARGGVGARKRMDWSEYLEPIGRDGRGGVEAGVGDGGEDIKVTTEMPQESPKITTSKRPSNANLGVTDNPKSLIKPSLPKRQRTEESTAKTATTSTSQVQQSKWSEYLEGADDFGGERGGLDGCQNYWAGSDECITTELVVEDEVYTDFM